MIVQIYETQDKDEAHRLVEAGVDHIGVLVGHGDFAREIPPERAGKILESINGRARKIALTLSGDPAEIVSVIEATKPDIIHLGTTPESLTPDDMAYLKDRYRDVGLMRTIPVVNEQSVDMACQYDGVVDFLLLDTHKAGESVIGATGLTHDWNLSTRIVESVSIPVILAGGLGPENVADAIEKVRPFGVDSKTRTDLDGTHRKDLDKVGRFVQIAKAVK